MIRKPVKTIEDLSPLDFKVIMEMMIALKLCPEEKKGDIEINVNGVTVAYNQFYYLYGNFVRNYDRDPDVTVFIETMGDMVNETIAARREENKKRLREVIRAQIKKADDEF